MDLQHIRSIEETNAYLDMTFLPMVNTRYVVRPLDSANGHRSKPSDAKIAMTLAWQETRSVARDWTISWRNKRFQIDARNRALNLPGRRVTVIEKRNEGEIQVFLPPSDELLGPFSGDEKPRENNNAYAKYYNLKGDISKES